MMKSRKHRIFDTTESIWREFGIYPNLLTERIDVEQVRSDVREQLSKIGLGNLHLLFSELQIALPDDSIDAYSLANVLITSLPKDLLVHAFEFQRRRQKAIDEIFLERVPKAELMQSRVIKLGSNNKERLEKITKLLLLIDYSVLNLRDIFYLDSWASKDTKFRFSAIEKTDDQLCTAISSNLDKLTEMLGSCSDLGGERLGCHDLDGKAFVIVHLRKFRPRISRDYAKIFNLHHVCGTLIMGVSHVDGYLHLKTASKKVADTVQEFLEKELGFTISRIEEQVVQDFDSEPLSNILKGKLPKDSRFKLTGISLDRTSIGGVPLSIPSTRFNDAILQTLEALHDASIVSSATPVALKSLDFVFQDQEVTINCEPISGGALRLTYPNSGLTDQFQELFENSFKQEFGAPLNKQLDPSRWSLGTAGIISFIIRAKTAEEIQDFQYPIFNKLKSLKIIEEKVTTFLTCTNFNCNGTALSEEASEERLCSRCKSNLKPIQITVLSSNEKVMRKWISHFLKKHTDWELEAKTMTFEQQKYFPIFNHSATSQIMLGSVFQHRMSEERQLTFDRASMPLVKFSDHYLKPPFRLERDDTATVSLPGILRALFEDNSETEVANGLTRVFSQLQSTYDSRVSRAARLSADRLESIPIDQDGDKYEVDVFNLIRWLFWRTNRLGRKGAREPDGFLSLQDYRNCQSVNELQLWNLGYDAKFSAKESGYDFGTTEQRQAEEYIRKYFKAKHNGVRRGRHILGHAIISNNIESSKIQRFVNHLRSQGVISTTNQSPIIVLIHDHFFLKLYRVMSQNQLTFQKKRLHLHFLFITLLEESTPHGFIELGNSAAEYILSELDDMEPIEDGLSIQEVEKYSFGTIPSKVFTPSCEPTAPEYMTSPKAA